MKIGLHNLIKLNDIINLVPEINLDILSKSGKTYNFLVEGNPEVKNRRKYPRLVLSNSCTIKMNGKSNVSGTMANISAGGLSFIVSSETFTLGSLIKVSIKDFGINKDLSAVVIRETSLDNGKVQYSCRMLDDDTDVEALVNKGSNKRGTY